ncbi:hypothetical protein scyTo_0021479 [Scyliorhinus torazame]|uniref:EGF-like domain-containing protein n=1 Tax=Scyliorhinus torazame TaxID=75743 RepID=A0A401Q938_SCYTO|nr:hypothetical protein [Scyliorhinus torazame]
MLPFINGLFFPVVGRKTQEEVESGGSKYESGGSNEGHWLDAIGCKEGYQGVRCDQYLPKTDSILSDPSMFHVFFFHCEFLMPTVAMVMILKL